MPIKQPLVHHLCIWQVQVHQFKTDPLMDQGPMRVRTGRAFLDAFAHIANPTTGARMLTLPILMVASKTDQVNISNATASERKCVLVTHKERDFYKTAAPKHLPCLRCHSGM